MSGEGGRMKTERCIECDEETGRAGKDDDSNYMRGEGPFCDTCMQDIIENTQKAESEEVNS